jgi:hypothetical protein
VDPTTITQNQTDIIPGRPTSEHHNDPEVRLLKHYETNRAQPLSKLHCMTLLSGEQQTYAYYKAHGNYYGNRTARELYAEIGEVEEHHVSFYESLLDPTETPLQRQVQHELMEVYNYFHCYTHETDPRIKAIWEEFLAMELTHLHLWGEQLQRYQGVDPQVLFGGTMQVDFKFQSNKEYVRHVLERQRDLRLIEFGWAKKDDLPKDWASLRYQAIVNADGVPSEEITRRQFQERRPVERPGDELLERARTIALDLRDQTTGAAVAKNGKEGA